MQGHIGQQGSGLKKGQKRGKVEVQEIQEGGTATFTNVPVTPVNRHNLKSKRV